MNLDQVRAQHAFTSVQGIQQKAEFLKVARALPAMLQTNGLLATWAHLLAKKRAELAAAEALLAYLREAGFVAHGDTTPLGVLQLWAASEGALSGPHLRRLTREATVYSVWLKRAAEALCESTEAVAGAPHPSAAAPREST